MNGKKVLLKKVMIQFTKYDTGQNRNGKLKIENKDTNS